MKVKLFFVIAIAILTVGCASAGGNLVITENTVHDALSRVDDQVTDFCDANSNMIAPCQDVRKVLLPTLEAGDAFNRAVASQRVTAIAPLIEAVGRLVTEVRKLPDSASADMVRELASAISAAYAVLGPAPERE
jgi:hypothetical protein